MSPIPVALFILAGAACSSKAPPASSAEASTTAAQGSGDPDGDGSRQARARPNRFVWRLGIEPDQPHQQIIELGPSMPDVTRAAGWSCTFEVEPLEANAEFGHLTCSAGTDRVSTTVYCHEAPDVACGAASLRLGDGTASQLMQLTCGCLVAPHTVSWPEGPTQAPSSSGFQWKVDYRGPYGRSLHMPVSDGAEIPASINGWTCTSALHKLSDATARSEVGRIRCVSDGSGRSVETQVACQIQDLSKPYCGVGSLSLNSGELGTQVLFLACKSPDSDCW